MKPRVLIIDGPEIAGRVDLARRLADYDVTLVGARDHDRTLGGFKYHRYSLGRGVNPLSIVRTYWQLRQIIRRTRPEVVQTFMTSPGIWGRLAAKHERVPVILGTMTGLGALYGRDQGDSAVRRVYERLLRHVGRASAMTVFQNDRDLSEMVQRRMIEAEKATLIPGSGVDTGRFRPADDSERRDLRRKFDWPDNEIVFVMASRLLRSKGVAEYCHAAEVLGDEATFVLLGDVDPRNRDTLTTREVLNLTQNVIWPGRVTNMHELLQAADAFALPTRYREGIPRAVIEAMASGLPVLTTPEGSGGIQCGVVIEQHDDDAVRAGIQAVLRLSRESRQRIGEWNRKYAERHLSIDVIASQYGRLYDRLLEQTRRSAVSAQA